MVVVAVVFVVIQAGKYTNLRMIQDDIIVLIKNAHYFNQPASDIYKKASVLRKFVIHRCNELERKYRTVAISTSSVTSPEQEAGLEGAEEDKKTPKLKISMKGREKNEERSASMSSVSDMEEEEDYEEGSRWVKVVNDDYFLFTISGRLLSSS